MLDFRTLIDSLTLPALLQVRACPPATLFPCADGLGIEADDPPDAQVRNPAGADELIESGAVDAEPLRKLARIPQRLDGGRDG